MSGSTDLAQRALSEPTCSSSFGDSLGPADSDVDVDQLRKSDTSDTADSIERSARPPKERSLNPAWWGYLHRRSIEWRCRWLELRMREMHLQRRRYKALLHKMKSKDRRQLLQHTHLQQQQQQDQQSLEQNEGKGCQTEEPTGQLGGSQGLEAIPSAATPGVPDNCHPPLGSPAAPGRGALPAARAGSVAALQRHAAGRQNSEASHQGLWEEADGEASIGAGAPRQGEGQGGKGGEGEGGVPECRGESADCLGQAAAGMEGHAVPPQGGTACKEEQEPGDAQWAFPFGEEEPGGLLWEGSAGDPLLAARRRTAEQRGCARTLGFPDDLLSACFNAAPDAFQTQQQHQQQQGQEAQPGRLSPAHQWDASAAPASLWGPGVPLEGQGAASCQGSITGLGMGVGMGMGMGMGAKAWQTGDAAAAGPSRRRRLYRRRPHRSLFAADPCAVDAHMAAHPIFSQYEAPLNEGNHSDQGNGSELVLPGKSSSAAKRSLAKSTVDIPVGPPLAFPEGHGHPLAPDYLLWRVHQIQARLLNVKGALAATQSPLPVPAQHGSPAPQQPQHPVRGGVPVGAKPHRAPLPPAKKQKSSGAPRHPLAGGPGGAPKRGGGGGEARQEAARPKAVRNSVSSVEQRAIALKRQKLDPDSNFELPEVARSSSRRRGAPPLGVFQGGPGGPPAERPRGVPSENSEAASDSHPSTPRPGALAVPNGFEEMPGGLFLDGSDNKQPPRRPKR